MAFTAKDVKELREMTGCGMMDCKKALAASDGDKDKAIEFLREKGLAAQQKKAGRIAAEGVVVSVVEGNVGVVLDDVGDGIGQGAAHVRVVSAAVECGDLACELNDVLVNGLAAVELGGLVVDVALGSGQVAGDRTGVGQQIVIQLDAGTEGALQEVEGQLGVLAVGGNGPACAAAVCVVGGTVDTVQLGHRQLRQPCLAT